MSGRHLESRAFQLIVRVSMPLLAWAAWRGTFRYYQRNPNG